MASSKKTQEENPHKGHRQRVFKRYDLEGFDSFEEHNILEMLLFYSLPRGDTNNIAHLLITSFGSLFDVLKASEEELQTVPGIGPASAQMLHAVFEGARIAAIRKVTSRPLRTYGQIHQIAVEWFADKPAGTALAILMDKDDRVLDLYETTREYVMNASTPAESVIARARSLEAVRVVYVHNHLEDLIPSDSDLLATDNLFHDLEAAGIQLLEHLIVRGFDTLPILDRSLGQKCSAFPMIPQE